MSQLSDYERELAAVRSKIEGIRTKISQLGQEEAELVPVARGWEAIVARERKDSGQPMEAPIMA